MTTPSPVAALAVLLAATLVAFLAAAWLGRRGRHRAHVATVAAASLMLLLTIGQAERLGRLLDFPGDRLRLHFVFAYLGALGYLSAAASGALLLGREDGQRRRRHRLLALLFLAAALVATVTGAVLLQGAAAR
jgi:hypothetical protein